MASRRNARAARALALLLFAAACTSPADNETPNDTPSQAGSAMGGSSGVGPSCESECVKQVFSVKGTGCKTCHDSGANTTLKASGLDLVTPGYTARLLNVPALHDDITAMGFNKATDCPQGDLLINAADPPSSWLLKKIRKLQDKCGDKMPSNIELTLADQACIETYLTCLVGGKSLDAGGGAATGGSGAGTGGGGAGGVVTGGGGAGGASGGTGGSS